MIYQLLGAVQEKVYQIVYSLLKFGGTIKDSMLDWLGGCLHANKGRAKMWSHQMLPQLFNATFSSDAFFLNLCVLMLRLAGPMTTMAAGGGQRPTLRVQPTYCLATVGDRSIARQRKVHMIDVKETCMLPTFANSEPPVELDAVYTFMTECFFMTHSCLSLGFRTLHERLVKLNQDLHRVQQVYQELMEQGTALSDTAQRLKQDMDRVMTVYLSLKAALSQPALLDSCFAFHVATATYLVAMATDSSRDGVNKEAPAVILQCIPEQLAENIQDFMLFVRRFKDQLFEQRSDEDLSELLTFILKFMGSPQYMRNPHLRAGMAEVLETLLPPRSTTNTSVLLSTHFRRERLFQTHPLVEQLASALINVFVSIEMTGQGVQFEHKFRYRQPMYVALEYIWNIEAHRQAIKSMAEDAEQHIEDTEAPLFLRFINLLINDAIYLLDEALSYMSQIKEKQQLRDNGTWPSLPVAQRNEAEAGYRHMSMLARFHNIMGNETIHALVLITSEIRSIFTNNVMVDRIAAMLNYFLLHLVGPKNKNLKVKNFDEFQFRPRQLVADICRIYVNLGLTGEPFCRAVSRDGRSYSHKLFKEAEEILCKIHEPADLIAQFNQLGSNIQALCSQQEAEDELLANVPEEFIDPIMGDLMRDPVVLPSSGKIVDRSTIARHILSDQFDPFNRQPLTMDMVRPATELKQQIDNWIAQNQVHK
jgi:ubiquitin conjugation factor E4 A